ncbi:MAG: oxidoreductase [Bacteroidia bacterium]|nr:oxidoreductase [Bacteroidia bacterium]
MQKLSMMSALFAFLFSVSLSLPAQPGFTDHQTGMTGSIRGLDVVSKKVIWISGTQGEFSVTHDGGKTWFYDTIPGGRTLDFRDVHGFSADVALLMSAGPGKASAIYRTENGGKSWVLAYQNTDEKGFFDGMDFFDENHGLLISDPIDEKPYLLESLDGGRTWLRKKPQQIPDLIAGEYAFAASGTSLDAASDGSCYLATGGSVARVFRSADYGRTWEVASLTFLQGDPAAGAFSVAHGSGKNVAAAGGHYQKMTIAGSNIALSGDNGQTWTLPTGAALVPFMECIRWIDQETLVVCGPPGVWMSSDSGKNWKEISIDGFHAMDVVPGKGIIWLAGGKGKVVTISL